jgi:hypothetical protein
MAMPYMITSFIPFFEDLVHPGFCSSVTLETGIAIEVFIHPLLYNCPEQATISEDF